MIIPALNEAALLPETLDLLNMKRDDVIVVDGGSSDKTAGLARVIGARVIVATRGRGLQMNAGAAAARGDILLFLHADTHVPEDYASRVLEAIDGGAAGGAFRLAIDAPGFRYRCIETGVRMRSRLLGLPYGDQAFFVTRSTFDAMGGFREMEIMEDLDFAARIRKFGRFELLDAHVHTSARRWQHAGAARVTVLNQVILLGYLAGVPTSRLAAWYGALPRDSANSAN